MPGAVRLRTIIGLLTCLAAAAGWAQVQPAVPNSQCPQTTDALYSRIRSVALDPQRVYHVRDAHIDRPNLHIDLDDGTLAFTEDICGRITGAFFEGEGEIRLRPPNRVERGSLALFTGMAILEEQFTSGYLRFNDDTAALLQRSASPASEGEEITKEWSDTGRVLAEFDALRLLLDFSHFLPTPGGDHHNRESDRKFPPLLHAHLLAKNWAHSKYSAIVPAPSRYGQASLGSKTAFRFSISGLRLRPPPQEKRQGLRWPGTRPSLTSIFERRCSLRRDCRRPRT